MLTFTPFDFIIRFASLLLFTNFNFSKASIKLKLFELENVELEFKEGALNEIAKKAISKKTGARGLRSILESILLKTMFELPELENVLKVTVDKSAVVGETQPVVTYGKKESTAVA